ncbi:hypothetical protein SARC_14178, partial [Sphaeroforma arctica JP610]
VSSTARDTITATEKIYYTKETQTDSNWMDDEIEKQVQQRLADMEAAQKQKEAIEEEKRIAKEEAAAQARHEQGISRVSVGVFNINTSGPETSNMKIGIRMSKMLRTSLHSKTSTRTWLCLTPVNRLP